MQVGAPGFVPLDHRRSIVLPRPVDEPPLEGDVCREVIKMKAMTIIIGLVTLAIETLAAEDRKSETPKQSVHAAPVLKQPASLMLRNEAPNEIILKKVTLKGPLVALAKSDKRLRTFNPFTPAKNGSEPEDFKNDPYVGRPRGIVLFSIGFQPAAARKVPA